MTSVTSRDSKGQTCECWTTGFACVYGRLAVSSRTQNVYNPLKIWLLPDRIPKLKTVPARHKDHTARCFGNPI